MFESEVFQKLLDQYAAPIVQAAKQEMQQEVLAAKQEVQEIETKYREQLAAKEAELHRRDQALQDVINSMHNTEAEVQNVINDLHDTLEQSLVARFPEAPVALSLRLRQFTSTTQLNALIRALVAAPSLRDFEQAVQQMEASNQN